MQHNYTLKICPAVSKGVERKRGLRGYQVKRFGLPIGQAQVRLPVLSAETKRARFCDANLGGLGFSRLAPSQKGVNDNVHFLNLASSGYDIIDSAEEPLLSKSDSEKDHLRCIPRQFKSRTDEASA
jgi:hypothetical protein